MLVRRVRAAIAIAGAICVAGAANADDRTLKIDLGSEEELYTSAELLARSDVSRITVPHDVAYGRVVDYRAVPLLSLLKISPNGTFDTLEARAADGFVSQIPWSLITQGATGVSTAWLAVEDPAKPWPDLPRRDASAGSFWLIWEHPRRSGIGGEQWPFALTALRGVKSPIDRWPQMAVAADLPAEAPARRGEEVYLVQCLSCHRIKLAKATWVPTWASP